MTKTSVDVYMLFTCFVNFKDDYEGLFKICNTDTYLYCFYIKKENIFLSRIYILLSFINKHIFFCELHIWFLLSEPNLNEQKDLKAMWKKDSNMPNYRSQLWYSGKKKCHLYFFTSIFYAVIELIVSICLLSRPKKNPKKCMSLYTCSWFDTRRLSWAAIQRD